MVRDPQSIHNDAICDSGSPLAKYAQMEQESDFCSVAYTGGERHPKMRLPRAHAPLA